MADLRGAPPPKSIVFIFMQFLAKIMPDNRLAPPGVDAPSWICDCTQLFLFWLTLKKINRNIHYHYRLQTKFGAR